MKSKNTNPRGFEISKKKEISFALEIRAKIYKAIRKYLYGQGFLEVETPILASKKYPGPLQQFKVHDEQGQQVGWLRFVPEQFTVRLLLTFDKIFELGKDFRPGWSGPLFNPEYSILAIYMKNADWKEMMSLTENLTEYIVSEVIGSTIINFDKYRIDLSVGWPQITFRQYVMKMTGIDIEKHPTKESLRKAMLEVGIDAKIGRSRERLLFKLSSEYVKPSIIRPTFVTQLPREWKWSSKVNEENPEVRDQAEAVLAGGIEFANVYTIETDLKKIQESKGLSSENKENGPIRQFDDQRINDIACLDGARVGESALGLDRLVMLLTNLSLKEVISFPWGTN
ncbi:amino acid--tRNA ligase-related protein [Thermodesulfobacteriota bacterium]